MDEKRTYPETLDEAVAVFRRFNRLHTRYLGTLREGYLDTEFSLAEARVLYELAKGAAPRAKAIGEALGIDAGYLSRVLAKFENAGLLKKTLSDQDLRSATLTLTRKGKSAFAQVNERSDAQARGAIEHLTPVERTHLLRSMRRIEEILMPGDQAGSPYVFRPHRPGDMGWVVCRESVGYAEEYGWDSGFEAIVSRIVADFLSNFDARRERCWIAERDGESLGHIFLVKHPDDAQTAKLRLLFVEPGARGQGLGDALVKECIAFARTAGYRRIVLWTHSVLVAAHRIYARAGFKLIEEKPHHDFGPELMGQTWELVLS